jgi:hypothetical protein
MVEIADRFFELSIGKNTYSTQPQREHCSVDRVRSRL